MELHYLSEEKDRHGNMRLYFRRYGRRVRLKSPIGTPEFLEEYKRALSGARPTDGNKLALPKSLRWLVERYFVSAEFKRLSSRTQYVKRMTLEEICKIRSADGTQHGDKPFALLEPRHVRRLRDAKAARLNKDGREIRTPEAANQLVKILRQVFAWAIETLDAKSNPARDVAYLRSGTDGFHTWTWEEVTLFQQAHPVGTKARLAMDLMLFTGMRRSDIVTLGRHMERENGQIIAWVEAKGRNMRVKARELPILPELRKSIDAATRGGPAYLLTEFGKPFTSNGFGNWFRKRCDEAGLYHCSAHGLRKAGATIAANNGATEFELMALFGWESPKEAARYTKKADRKRMAARAVKLLVPDKNRG